MAKRDDIQWVSWHSFHRGNHQRTKWHARLGFDRGPKATLCGRAISPIDSIAMEQLGSYRRESPPIKKDKTCQRCLDAATKIHEQRSSQMVFEVEIELNEDQSAPTPDDIHDWILNGMKATVGEPPLIVVNPS